MHHSIVVSKNVTAVTHERKECLGWPSLDVDETLTQTVNPSTRRQEINSELGAPKDTVSLSQHLYYMGIVKRAKPSL